MTTGRNRGGGGLDDDAMFSEDGKGKIDLTEKIRKRRQAVKREKAEELGHITKAVAVPLKPGEYVPGS